MVGILDRPFRDPEKTIIIMGLHQDNNENLELKVSTLLAELGEDVYSSIEVVGFERLRSRNRGPGLVKVAFRTQDQKVKVLQEKSKVMESERYRGVFIRSCKSHVERVLENNLRTVMSLLPDGQQYRFTGSGRLVRKDDPKFNQMSGQEHRNNGQIQRQPHTVRQDEETVVSPASIRYTAVPGKTSSQPEVRVESSAGLSQVVQMPQRSPPQRPQVPGSQRISQGHSQLSTTSGSRIQMSAPMMQTHPQQQSYQPSAHIEVVNSQYDRNFPPITSNSQGQAATVSYQQRWQTQPSPSQMQPNAQLYPIPRQLNNQHQFAGSFVNEVA